MSRVCLLGMGVPAFVASCDHAGPGLRCGHFAAALAEAGHDVLVVYVTGGRSVLGADAVARTLSVRGSRVACLEVGEADFDGEALGRRVRDFSPDALVAATAYAGWLACRLPLDVPFWADVFGDLMAEAQSKALVYQSDLAVVRLWSVLQTVLSRADRFSAVSGAQANALVGQLGMVGRLSSATAGERLVHVIACAADVRASDRRPAGRGVALRGDLVPDDAFVVLWSGSFNTWCDVDTAFAGIERAMQRDASVRFVATGGSVRGHDERSYPRFRDLVQASSVTDRFHLLGRLDDGDLTGLYECCDVGINVERDVYERRLGSENRIVDWAASGLPTVTTGLSELGRCLAMRGLCFTCPPGDADALADTLVELALDRERVREVGLRLQRFATEHLSVAATAAPLLEWAAAPRHAGDHRRRRPLTVGLVSEPAAMVALLEDYLAELTLPQLAYRSSRWLLRRLLGRGGLQKRGDDGRRQADRDAG